MTKKRILKYSCLTFSVICGLFVCTSAVFAATQQSISCTTKVNYDPAIKAVVEVKVGSGSYETVFNNTGNSSSSESSYFYLITPPGNSSSPLYSSSSVQFKVTNYTTDKAITASVRLATGSDTGVDIPSNVDLYKTNNEILSNVTLAASASPIGAYSSNTAASYAESSAFYVQTLFPETIVPFIITLETTS